MDFIGKFSTKAITTRQNLRNRLEYRFRNFDSKGLTKKFPYVRRWRNSLRAPNEIDFFSIALFFTLYNMLRTYENFFASPFESSKFRNFENGFPVDYNLFIKKII